MSEFPILKRKINGKRLVYLDNAATTQKPQVVIDAIVDYYQNHNANIHRGIYTLSEESTQLYGEARKKVAALVNCPAEQLIFTSGTTDAINLVAHGLDFKEGDEILLTPLEHHANIVPWQEVAKRSGAKILFCDLKDDFTIDIDDLKSRINSRTKIVALTHVSNVTGAITTLADIIPFAKAQGALVLVDGAQAVGHLPVDIKQLGCDFYAFSGHKMYGPMGIGCLYIGKEQFSLKPYRTGGDMIDDVTEMGSEFAINEVRRFEAGTPNVAGAIGMGAAADYLQKNGFGEDLAALTREKLKELPSVTLYGAGNTVLFTVEGIHPHDVAQLLDAEGVCIRSGKHCAHPLLKRMNIPAANRASFGIYNTAADVDALVAAIKKAIEVFK